jgi:nucleotide-binding universal stress UspA family protein
MTRVMIAVDETDASVHAAEVAHGLFGSTADYVAISVAEVRLDPATLPWWESTWGVTYPIAVGAVWPYRDVRAAQRAGVSPRRDAADTAAAVVAEAGVTGADTLGELGDPAEAIVRAADNEAADVIVVAAHERSWLSRIMHPSVAKEVVKRADVPVLVVP